MVDFSSESKKAHLFLEVFCPLSNDKEKKHIPPMKRRRSDTIRTVNKKLLILLPGDIINIIIYYVGNPYQKDLLKELVWHPYIISRLQF